MRSLAKGGGHTSYNRESHYLVSVAVINSISISGIRNFGLGSPNMPFLKEKEIHAFIGNFLIFKCFKLIIYLKTKIS